MQTAGTLTKDLIDIAEEAGEPEQQGADIATSLDVRHDPIIQLAVAASATERIKLMSGITVAFARSPMTLALSAHDVNALSRGDLQLVGAPIFVTGNTVERVMASLTEN